MTTSSPAAPSSSSSGAARGARSARGRGLRPWLSWLAVGAVVLVALAVGTLGQDDPTDAERAQNLAETIRCPTCKSQAVSSSETPSAKAVRELIRRGIADGDSDEEIRDFVASRYGREVLLEPEGSGFGALVWALPVVLVVVAVAGLVVRFRDWRPGAVHATDDDRALVDAALAGRSSPSGASDAVAASAPSGGADPTAEPASEAQDRPGDAP